MHETLHNHAPAQHCMGARVPGPCLQHLSHLYKNTGALVGAYLRIDIPKLPQLDQYNYVLFTGAHWARGLAAAGAMALPA